METTVVNYIVGHAVLCEKGVRYIANLCEGQEQAVVSALTIIGYEDIAGHWAYHNHNVKRLSNEADRLFPLIPPGSDNLFDGLVDNEPLDSERNVFFEEKIYPEMEARKQAWEPIQQIIDDCRSQLGLYVTPKPEFDPENDNVGSTAYRPFPDRSVDDDDSPSITAPPATEPQPVVLLPLEGKKTPRITSLLCDKKNGYVLKDEYWDFVHGEDN